MSATPLNWKPVAGRALEAALNRALSLDVDARQALRPLQGRRVAIGLEHPSGKLPPLALQVKVDGERLAVGPLEAGEEPDLSVRSTLGGLLWQLPFLRNDNAPPVGTLRIEGDAELARRLQKLAASFDPDWQRPFAAVLGDVLGVQVAKAFSGALKQARRLAANGAETLAEYVTEESRDVVPKAELNAFHDDVDALRDDVERLAARIGRLQAGA